MIERLNPADHDWMTAPETVAVMQALSPDGADLARFVGGCVRNTIMGHCVDDIDIATRLEPEQTVRALNRAGLKAIPTGIDHGTITGVAGGKPFEITSLRKDVETFGRRAVVAFTQDWSEDAVRRDFRMNAIYARPDGVLFDPFDGVKDARARRVVFIGSPKDRLAEDVLRILRFYRFNAWYGSDLDEAGHAACCEMAHHLPELASERVWKELKKLLKAPDPHPVIAAMHKGHVLGEVWPGTLDLNLLLSLINTDKGKARSVDPLLRAAALSGGDEINVRNLCVQMKASNAERDRLSAMTKAVSDLPGAVKAPDVNACLSGAGLSRALYALGACTVADRARLSEARGEGAVDALLEAAETWTRPRLPIGGRDLIDAGLPRGPELGSMLAKLEEIWVNSEFALTRDDLLDQAREGQA